MPTLNWIGKDAVVNHHKEVPFHLLKCDEKLSVRQKDLTGLQDLLGLNDNLLVQGDNLLALKALLPHYAGQVKCIYIDPPYNTGEESWVYDDRVNSPEMREWLGKVVGDESQDLSRHDKWLSMMYPRLSLLWNFLRDDGSIWISIDDNEIASLQCLMYEIAGRDKFIASNVWQKRYSRENREAIGDVHEYIVVYAKNKEAFTKIRNKTSFNAKNKKVYKNLNNDPRGPWRPVPITAQAGHATEDQFYEIVAPSGRVFTPPEGRCWSLSKDTFERLRNEGLIYFGKNGNSQPNVIRYLTEVEGLVPWTWWPHDEVGHTDESKKEIYTVLGKTAQFDNPKPTRLMRRIIEIATNSGDLILDSFAGSGTTGHAVLKMNKEDGGNRRFILVEMDESISKNITAERLKRVSQGYEWKDQKGNQKKEEGLGGGFRFCTLGETLFDADGQIRREVSFEDLARHVYFTETGMPLPERPPSSSRTRRSTASPLLGIHNGVAVYLLYNGIMKDKSRDGGNVLTRPLLAALPEHDGAKVIYGNGTLLGENTLRSLNITFRQVPYEIKIS